MMRQKRENKKEKERERKREIERYGGNRVKLQILREVRNKNRANVSFLHHE